MQLEGGLPGCRSYHHHGEIVKGPELGMLLSHCKDCSSTFATIKIIARVPEYLLLLSLF